jgi:hypothetical protein
MLLRWHRLPSVGCALLRDEENTLSLTFKGRFYQNEVIRLIGFKFKALGKACQQRDDDAVHTQKLSRNGGLVLLLVYHVDFR